MLDSDRDLGPMRKVKLRICDILKNCTMLKCSLDVDDNVGLE